MLTRFLFICLICWCVVHGCAAPPEPGAAASTFLRSVDLIEMTDKMAQSFASDTLIGNRWSDDQPWVISIFRIVNHQSDHSRAREVALHRALARHVVAVGFDSAAQHC